ncbi:MAG: DUF2339 domain-containing protein [Paenibacillaceae bacterium]
MDVQHRLEQLEQKVVKLEQQVDMLKNHRYEPFNPTSSTQALDQVQAPPTRSKPDDSWDALLTKQQKELPVTKEPIDWEHLIARVWLPRIFIVVFLLGVLWGFSAAVSAGIITEPVRCWIGLVVAGIMLWQGERQMVHSRKALGQVLLGGAVSVVILSLFAAHMLYDLIPSYLAFMLYILSIGLGIAVSIRHRSQALIIITLIAGYLVPFLIDSADPDLRVFVAYLAIFSITMILLTQRLGFRPAMYIAFGVLHLPLLIGYAFEDGFTERYAFLIAVLIQHAVLFILHTFRQNVKQSDQSTILFTSFGLLAAWSYGMFEGEFTYPLILGVASTVYSLIAATLITYKKAFSVYMAIATWGWFLWLVEVIHVDFISMTLVVEGTIAILLGITYGSKLQQVVGFLTYMIGSIWVLGSTIHDVRSVETLAWSILLISVAIIYVYIRKAPVAMNTFKSSRNCLVWIEAVLFLIFISQVTNAATDVLDNDYQYLILSTVWLIYAIAIIAVGIIAQIRKARLAGIMFLLITLVKVIFVDLPFVSMGIRAILFLGLGGIGVAVSRLFYKNKKEVEPGEQSNR